MILFPLGSEALDPVVRSGSEPVGGTPPVSGEAPAEAPGAASGGVAGGGQDQGGVSSASPETGEAPGADKKEEGSEAPPPKSEAKPPGEAPVKPGDWRDRRIAQLTARLREEQEKNRQGGEAAPAPVVGEAGLSEADVERRATVLANERAAQLEFNRQCDATAQAGRATFGEADFNARVQNLTKLVDLSDPASVSTYNSFLSAAIETGEGPRLVHELGANLDEAARILALPPVRMAVALAKLASARPDTSVSGAPKPPTPVGSRGTSHESIDPTDPDRADRLSTAEWVRRREVQLARMRTQGNA